MGESERGRVGRGRKIGINADVNVWRDEGREKEGTREGDDGGRVICVTGTTRAPRLSRPPASLSGALLAGVEPSRGRVPSPNPWLSALPTHFPFIICPSLAFRSPFIETGSRSRDLASLSNLVFFHHRESCTTFFFSPSPSFYTFFPHLCSLELILGE